MSQSTVLPSLPHIQCRPACTLPSCSSPYCPPIRTRRPGGGGRGSPPAPPLSAAHWLRRQPPAGPAGGAPVPVTASDLPSPALSERISGRSAAMERRAATAAARRGGGGGRESLAPCRLAQRRGWALQREPGALRTVRESEAEGAEMRLLSPRC